MTLETFRRSGCCVYFWTVQNRIVCRHFGPSKIMVVELYFEPSIINTVDQNIWPSKITVVDRYLRPSQKRIVDFFIFLFFFTIQSCQHKALLSRIEGGIQSKILLFAAGKRRRRRQVKLHTVGLWWGRAKDPRDSLLCGTQVREDRVCGVGQLEAVGIMSCYQTVSSSNSFKENKLQAKN